MDKIDWKIIWRKETAGTKKSITSLIGVGNYKGYKVKKKVTNYTTGYRSNSSGSYYITGVEPNPYDSEDQLIRAINRLIKEKEAGQCQAK